MVKLIIPTEESEKVHKYILRALKLFVRVGVTRQKKGDEYHKTRSQKNREARNKLRQMRKHASYARKAVKHKFT